MGRPAQPYEAGNREAMTHGVWARDVAEVARRRVGDLFPPDLVERHPMVAMRAAEAWVRLLRAEADVHARGMTLEDGSAHPLLRYIAQWDRYLLEVARDYGMTPKAEAALVREQADAARQIVDLDAIRAHGRQALEAKGRRP